MSAKVSLPEILGTAAAIVAVGGFLLFGERIQRIQVAGVALIAVGVTLLSVLSA